MSAGGSSPAARGSVEKGRTRRAAGSGAKAGTLLLFCPVSLLPPAAAALAPPALLLLLPPAAFSAVVDGGA